AASYTRYTGELPNVHRLMAELEVRVLSETIVSEIKPGEIAVRGLYDTGFRRFPDGSGSIRLHTKAAGVGEADAVVLGGDRQSRTALYRGLLEQRDRWDEAGIKGVYRIGDCVAARQLSEAIFDGHRLAREIDSPNPAVPLPVRREIYHWGATR